MLAAALGIACASEQPPPGALPDHQPPQIESIEPAPDSIVPGFSGALRVRFDEPVRVEDGSFLRQLVASPLEAYRLEKGFSDLRLQPRDGWRDSVVYCMEIPAGIRDLLSNQTEIGTQFCFSTGVEMIDSEVTGTVLNAETGLPELAASVVFLQAPDSVPYGGLTDENGQFELRSLPSGTYSSFAYVDQNGNFRLDRTLEPYDSATVTSFSGARPDLLFRLVEPDSTPPRLLRAEARDSFTVELEFDDALVRPQPGDPGVTLTDTTGTVSYGVFGLRMGDAASVSFPDAPGSAPADPEAAADSAQTPVGPPAVQDSTTTLEIATDELPTRFVTVRLLEALASGTYLIGAEGFTNMRLLEGGGDTTFVADVPEAVVPPSPDSAVIDDTAAIRAAGDTTAIDTVTARILGRGQ
jgi:hypothetical protein